VTVLCPEHRSSAPVTVSTLGQRSLLIGISALLPPPAPCSQVQYDNLKHFNVTHVNFRRWPRDPDRHPVKLAVPIIFTNEEALPAVKAGAYIHSMFAETGLKCLVRDPDNIPRFIVADMRRSTDGKDLRFEHLDMPPGVTVQPSSVKHLNDENFLVGRAKRIRG
jgi:hypothetical protein